MRISVVTTTLNAMPYIVETTHSVLQSQHHDLEYILIDAGSSDGTMEHIMSLKDSRVKARVIPNIKPYDAINVGFRESSGEVLAWLNGDDFYYPWTISCVGNLFTEFSNVEWIIGLPSLLNAEGHCTSVGRLAAYPRRYIQNGWFNELACGCLQQESMFWRRSLFEAVGGLNPVYDQAADCELWTRMAQHAELVALSVPLAAFRNRGTNRSIIGRSAYLRDVENATRSLPKRGFIIRYLNRASIWTQRAIRCLEWHRTSAIYFSKTESRWKLRSSIKRI